MLKITDQYIWNFIFTVFFVALLIMGVIILENESRFSETNLKTIDYILMTLATWRLVRLLVYDTVSKFIREQFWDLKKVDQEYKLVKPEDGPRRTLADLFSCPSCVSVWAGAVVVFFYLLTPYALVPVIILSVSVVASFLQNLGTMVATISKYLTKRVDR